MSSSPVAVTGMGCISAAGMSLDACMESAFSGVRRVSAPVGFSTTHPVTYPVFEILESVDSTMSVSGIEMTRTATLGLLAARQALADAGLDSSLLAGKRVGVCMGTTVGSSLNNETFYRQYRDGKNPGMSSIRRFFYSNPASCIAKEFSASGPTQTVVNACSSGTDSIGIGASWIRAGICDLVIAGGADELCRVTYNGFASLMITDPGSCRPFDVNRKGLNLGEGAAAVILESDSMVRQSNRTPRAFVYGYGTACDAHHLTAPKPDGAGLKRAIGEALSISGKKAEDMAFVNAHGTGTPDNDRVESRVLKDLLPGTPFISTKGYTGHTLGAAGAIEAVFTIACLERQQLPASIGFKDDDPELPVSPERGVSSVSGRFAMSESLAFGGNNSVIILGLQGRK